MTDQIQEYNQTTAALSILREKYGRQFDVTTTKGMTEAREARAVVKGYRVALEKVRQEIKAPALERTRLIDAEAKRITNELLAIEAPIDAAIKAEETRKAEERAAKERAEAARVAAIAARISAIRHRVAEVANQPAEAIRAALDQAQTLELTEAEFGEFLPNALEALAETRQALQTALENRIAHEAEEARLKAEREAEAARLKVERKELAKLREAEAARLKTEREAQEAELSAQREEQERRERETRQAHEAEEARLKAEREAMERQRAELDAQERAFEEQTKMAKWSRKGKADPVADLKKALNANPATAKALDEAYQRGYQAGLNSAKQAA